MKTLGLVISDKKIFNNCILKAYFLSRDLMHLTGTVWTTLVKDFGVDSEEKSFE